MILANKAQTAGSTAMPFLAPAVSHSSTPSSGSSFAEIGAMRYKNVNFKATIFLICNF
jgi:hypothetical protein